MLKRLNEAFDRAAARAVDRQKVLVEIGPEVERKLWRRDMARFATALIAIAVLFFAPTPWHSIAGPILGFIIGGSALRETQKATAYRSGWIAGRVRMAFAAQRHDERWLQTELEHDAVIVAGVRPTITGLWIRGDE